MFMCQVLRDEAVTPTPVMISPASAIDAAVIADEEQCPSETRPPVERCSLRDVDVHGRLRRGHEQRSA
jgi:hypothetical protein